MCYVPDDLPHDYILKISKPYLGKWISKPSDWTPLKHHTNVFNGHNNPQIDLDDPWQFKNFLDHRRRLNDHHAALKKLAAQHGTPLFVVDHDELRRNYAMFKKYLPRIQAYYAVKANPDPAIVKTLFDAGASFDVASMPEFRIVYEYIKHMPDKAAAGLDLGQDHLRQSHQGQRNAAATRTRTSRWSPTTITRKSAKSRSMRRTPAWPCG